MTTLLILKVERQTSPSNVSPKFGSRQTPRQTSNLTERHQLTFQTLTEDNQWYRAKIVKMCDPQSATVLFVDYGYTQLCPVEQVKAIDEDFVKLPPLAVHCKLAGIDETRDWTVEEKSKLESYTVGKLLSVTFTNRDPDGKYPVRLLEKTNEGKCVINEDFGAPCFAKVPPPSVGYTSPVVSIQPISVIR